jgi:hypothetical protein
MRKNNQIQPFIPLLPNASLRLEALVAPNEGDVACVDTAAVNDKGTSAARGSVTVKLKRQVEAVLPSAPGCDGIEGGMGMRESA